MSNLKPKSIRLLSPELILEIAAGEVITRPADVVKELIENALDAGAAHIIVELEAGGLKLIRVLDDGIGIPSGELALALDRHATSKLDSLAQISTLGFRGEALWSITFAADLVIESRPATQRGCLRLEWDGTVRRELQVPGAAGTRVEVRELFARLPARRQALESAASEVRRVIAVVNRYVLHHPGIRWRVVVDGEVRLTHAPSSFREAVATVWGALVANRLIPVEHEFEDGYLLQGMISKPELTRPRRDRLSVSINGRPVELEDGLAASVLRAYSSLLPRAHHPLAVLNLSVPFAAVNANTHPSKLRVGLLDAVRVERLIFEGLEAALVSHPLSQLAPMPQPISAPVTARSSFPRLKHLGTFRDAYLMAEGEGDLWLIDQHAAHERVIFEELEGAFLLGDRIELAQPELVTLTAAEVSALLERREELESWGFALEPFGPASSAGGLWRVRSLPAVLIGLPVEQLAREVVTHALGSLEARTSVLARFACHPAVRFGHRLSHESAQALLDALTECRLPWSCPHGRPTVLRWPERDLAHEFGRRSPRDLPKDSEIKAPQHKS